MLTCPQQACSHQLDLEDTVLLGMKMAHIVADHLHGVMALWVESLEWSIRVHLHIHHLNPALLHCDVRLPIEFRRQIELQRQTIQIAANVKFNTCL